MQKHMLIIVNAFVVLDSVKNQIARLEAEFCRRGARVSVLSGAELPAYIENGGIRVTAPPCDAVVYLDKDRHLSHALEKSGLRLFNRARAIELCDDKMMTAVALSGRGIAMPLTVSAPLCYAENPGDGFLDRITNLTGYPLVVKENYGSMGKQVYLAETEAQLKSIHAGLRHKPHIFQQFIAESKGRDLRVIVIGGKAAGCMLRRSDTDFRSNLELGGKAYPIAPDPAYIDLAERAAAALELDYCGIDLLFGNHGPILCEVNSNAFFKGFETITGIDVAGLYAEHILKNI